jgi:hypothetical protein
LPLFLPPGGGRLGCRPQIQRPVPRPLLAGVGAGVGAVQPEPAEPEALVGYHCSVDGEGNQC